MDGWVDVTCPFLGPFIKSIDARLFAIFPGEMMGRSWVFRLPSKFFPTIFCIGCSRLQVRMDALAPCTESHECLIFQVRQISTV